MSKSSSTIQPELPLDFWELFRELPESHLLFRANPPLYTIVDLNKARERLTRVSRAQAIGRPLFEAYPDTSEVYKQTGINKVEEALHALLASGKQQHVDALRYDLESADGRTDVKYWESTYTPIRDAKGKITYILAITHDVTKEQTTEQRVSNAEERLEAAMAIGKVGSWVWDVEQDIVVADSNLAKMFGITKAQGANGLAIATFIRAIHEDDRARVQKAIERSIARRSPFEEEYRTRNTKGVLRWVLARGRVEEHGGHRLFTGVIVDITERRDLQAQVELARKQDQLNRQEAKILQDRNEELEAIGRTKDEFVALASHQLRTPATAVKQYLGMVLQGYVGNVSEVQTDMLEKAFESNERQIQIINQILNAARVDTGRLIMTPVPLDLRTLVQGIADDMQSSFKQHNHSFGLHLPAQSVPVIADLGYLRMAIENILHNASVYTPEGGSVTLKLSKTGKRCRLSITDTGVGIKKADLGKLFTKFSRIHNPLSVQAGGSGIGLYLAAEIVRLHHGSVTVESKIHQGTTFAISLPLVQNN